MIKNKTWEREIKKRHDTRKAELKVERKKVSKVLWKLAHGIHTAS